MGRVSLMHGLVSDSRSSIYQFSASCSTWFLILVTVLLPTYLYLLFLEIIDNILVSPSLQRIFMNNALIYCFSAFVHLWRSLVTLLSLPDIIQRSAYRHSRNNKAPLALGIAPRAEGNYELRGFILWLFWACTCTLLLRVSAPTAN